MDFNPIIPILLSTFAGLSTGLGGLFVLFIFKKINQSIFEFFMGFSAGIMIYISLVELLQSGIETIGFLNANLFFLLGILFIMLTDFFVPHEYIDEHITCKNHENKKILKSAIYIALGITIHNFPEGLGVFITSAHELKLGFLLTYAILIHNIPEGIAVALPIYAATNNKWKALLYSFYSGIAEPLGAILAYLFLMPFLNPKLIAMCLSFVAGIMTFISFDELLPFCYTHEKNHIAIAGIMLGISIMALSIYLVNIKYV